MAENRKLREKKIRSDRIFSGRAVGFMVDTVELPNGKKATREYIDHPGAVAVLPVLECGKIVMVRQYRHPVGEITYELPAGKMHGKNDSFERRARAELAEETGYRAGSMRFLAAFWPTPAFSNEILKIYLAERLEKGVSSPDEDEFLDVAEIEGAEALEMIRNGKIKDAKTIIGIQAYVIGKLGKRGKNDIFRN